MLLEPIIRTMTKLLVLITICAYNVTIAQSPQVTMELSMVFKIPYIGPINRLEKISFGPNMRHSIESSNAERFYARLFVNESIGKIIDINEDLNDSPEKVNDDPYENGWMVKIQIEDNIDKSELLDSQSYTELIG